MNKNVQKLYQIAQKSQRLIIGLMSGTSMDGLDIALCQIEGSGKQTKLSILHFITIPYTNDVKEALRRVFAQPQIYFQDLVLLNEWLGTLHGNFISDTLHEWKISSSQIDLIASHGQTVFHAPKALHQVEGFPNATLQIGDADHIAVSTGIITISDFRQKHIAMGGEGAPLAVYGDYLVFSSHTENRILLNMGGIGNFTFLPSRGKADEIFVTDTGPCNTLIDAAMRHFYNKDFDENGNVAKNGKVNKELLHFLKNHTFFSQKMPKTTGPELFNMSYVQNAQKNTNTLFISPEDLVATLTQFSADTMVELIHTVLEENEKYSIYISGGGAHNVVLVDSIKKMLPNCNFFDTEVLGVCGDAKEAALFAVLANECIAGGETDFGSRKEVPNVTMGKVSFPS
jgi:anhydro-N-acetylmuramic acid kinase